MQTIKDELNLTLLAYSEKHGLSLAARTELRAMLIAISDGWTREATRGIFQPRAWRY